MHGPANSTARNCSDSLGVSRRGFLHSAGGAAAVTAGGAMLPGLLAADSAQFKTDCGHSFRVEVWWAGALRGCERAEWYGDKMSFLCETPYGTGPTLVHAGKGQELDSGGFIRSRPKVETYKQPRWWQTDMLPQPLRHNSGHEGSHTFITNEFINALVHERKPAVDVFEAVAYTAPGIVAHQSALHDGDLLKIPDFGRADRS